jgi:uncharacterized protein (TIGR02444 family)
MTTDAGADFWRFSQAFYALPGVASACLILQDRHGLDVNLALYCCWLGLSGRGRIDAARLSAADAAIASWRRDVIEVLRTARRALKAAAAVDAEANAVRERVKAMELKAERVCQMRLAALAPFPAVDAVAQRVKDARVGLETYLGSARVDGAPLFEALETFVDG